MREEIGRKIKHLRKSRKITQEELAQRLGGDISRSTISNYEIGRRTPHLRDLQRFAEVFGVGLDYFGIATTDEVFEVFTRAKEVFENENIPQESKEGLYLDLMKLYLELKGNDA